MDLWTQRGKERVGQIERVALNWGFPGSSDGKEFARDARDPASIPGSGRSSGEGKGYPLQYSGLENSMDCIVLGHKKLDTTERL